ncbi:MAG: DUF5678 domain-containing protein [Blastocatellia bacterium]
MNYDQLVGAVTGLPLVDQRRLLELLETRLKENGLVEHDSEVMADSARGRVAPHPNQLWLQANRDNYRGQWVVLYNGELVAHGTDGIAAVETARSKGIPEPFTAFIPMEDKPFAGF